MISFVNDGGGRSQLAEIYSVRVVRNTVGLVFLALPVAKWRAFFFIFLSLYICEATRSYMYVPLDSTQMSIILAENVPSLRRSGV